jgi:hypothetical protein
MLLFLVTFRLHKGIMADKDSRRIFHWNHVLDSARLRAGVDALDRIESERLDRHFAYE